MYVDHLQSAPRVLKLLIQTFKAEGGVVFQNDISGPSVVTSLATSEALTSIFLKHTHLVQPSLSTLSHSDLSLDTLNSLQLPASIFCLGWTTRQQKELFIFLHSSENRICTETDQTNLQTTLDLWEQANIAQEQRDILYHLEKCALSLPENALLQEILKAVIQQVPGADCANLLLHQGRHFQVWASTASNLSHSEVRLKASDLKKWYYETFNPDDIQGLKFTDAEINHHSLLKTLHVTKRPGITSSLYLPIALQGKPVALLNLDSYALTFDQNALNIMQLFAPSIGLAVKEHLNKRLLESTSRIDPLTGLENRQAFEQALYRESSRAQRYNTSYSLLLIDLKDFTQVNNQLGQLEGDDILIEVAQALNNIVRSSDMAFRWGGDEFAIILPNTAYQGAIVAARRFARAIKQIPAKLPIRLHVGVATYPQCAATATALEEVARKRLDEGKRKNITVLLSESALETLSASNP